MGMEENGRGRESRKKCMWERKGIADWERDETQERWNGWSRNTVKGERKGRERMENCEGGFERHLRDREGW